MRGNEVHDSMRSHVPLTGGTSLSESEVLQSHPSEIPSYKDYAIRSFNYGSNPQQGAPFVSSFNRGNGPAASFEVSPRGAAADPTNDAGLYSRGDYFKTFFEMLYMVFPCALVSIFWSAGFAYLIYNACRESLQWMASNPSYTASANIQANYVDPQYGTVYVSIYEWTGGEYNVGDVNKPQANDDGLLTGALILQIFDSIGIMLLPVFLYCAIYTRCESAIGHPKDIAHLSLPKTESGARMGSPASTTAVDGRSGPIAPHLGGSTPPGSQTPPSLGQSLPSLGQTMGNPRTGGVGNQQALVAPDLGSPTSRGGAASSRVADVSRPNQDPVTSTSESTDPSFKQKLYAFLVTVGLFVIPQDARDYGEAMWVKMRKPFLFMSLPGVVIATLIQALQIMLILKYDTYLIYFVKGEIFLTALFYIVFFLYIKYVAKVQYSFSALFVPLLACFLSALLGLVLLLPVYRALTTELYMALFRALAWPVIQEIVVGIPRYLVRRVPDGFIEKDGAIYAPLPVILAATFFGRLFLANVQNIPTLIVTLIVMQTVTFALRWTTGQRDRWYARIFSCLDKSDVIDLFSNNWAIRYRCLILNMDIMAEYINIIPAAMTIYTLNVVLSPYVDVGYTRNDLVVNVVIQIAFQFVADFLILYLQERWRKVPIVTCWRRRLPGTGLLLFIYSLLVLGFVIHHAFGLFAMTILNLGPGVGQTVSYYVIGKHVFKI